MNTSVHTFSTYCLLPIIGGIYIRRYNHHHHRRIRPLNPMRGFAISPRLVNGLMIAVGTQMDAAVRPLVTN